MPSTFENCAIYLIGFPGTGKFTVAQEMMARADHTFKLVDNHFINNVIFSLIETDGKTKLSPFVWGNVEIVRDVVLSTIQNLSPPPMNFLLTNNLADNAGDTDLYQRIESIFAARKALFVPVILTCEIAEHEKRMAHESRALRHKETNPEAAARYHKEGMVRFEHPHKFEIDVTTMPPAQTADLILERLHSLMAQQT